MVWATLMPTEVVPMMETWLLNHPRNLHHSSQNPLDFQITVLSARPKGGKPLGDGLPDSDKARNIDGRLIMTEAHQLIRTDWTQDEVKDLFEKSYLDLVFQAASVHRTSTTLLTSKSALWFQSKPARALRTVLIAPRALAIKPTLNASP